MMRLLPVCRMLILSGVFSLVAFGCKKPQARPAPPPPLVSVIRPGSADVQRYYEYNGNLDAVEMVMVQARVEGYLTKVFFKEGKKEGEIVEKDAKLYEIDPREYVAAVARSKADIAKANADIANGEAQIVLARAEVARLKQATSAVSRSDLDKSVASEASFVAQKAVAVANRDAADAALETSKLKLGYTDIRAPIKGRISRTLVTPGNLVGQKDATLLTTIVSLDPIYVYFDVPERDFVEYEKMRADPTQAAKMAARGDTPVEVGISTEEGYPHVGRIDFRENRVEPGTGTIRLRGTLPNPDENSPLYAGLYAKVRIPRGEPRELLVLPEEALMTGQEGTYVYVLDAENKVGKRIVKTLPQAIWRAGPAGDKSPPAWKLERVAGAPAPKEAPLPKGEAQPKAGAKGGPPPGAPPADPSAVRSVVAVEEGLKPEDRVIVSGLQKARPGAPVEPDTFELKGPPPKK